MKSLRYITRSLPASQYVNRRALLSLHNQTSRLSTAPVSEILKKRQDFEELFLNNNVRYMLKRLAGYDPKIVFATKSLNNLKSPKYRFMTDEQLALEREAADKRAEAMLQMPPLKYSSDSQPKVLEKDPLLKGFTEYKHIFVDSTPGFSDQERLIVVRDPDGTLREATREERRRMNQVFYPVEERQMEIPKMFDAENMIAVLERGAYKLLLENACLHFEPEDERFMDICHQVYEHISQRNAFDSLFSTRYYGGMVYYYVYFRRADNILLHLMNIDKLDDAYHLIQLFYIVNPRAGAPEPFRDDNLKLTMTKLAKICKHNRLSVPIDRFLDLLKFYIDNDAVDSQTKAHLQLAAQNLKSNSLKAEASS